MVKSNQTRILCMGLLMFLHCRGTDGLTLDRVPEDHHSRDNALIVAVSKQTLLPENPRIRQGFASTLSLSSDGKVALIGNGNDYRSMTQVWQQGSEGWAVQSDIDSGYFSIFRMPTRVSVSLSGDASTAVSGMSYSGASEVRVWAKIASRGWAQQQRLTGCNYFHGYAVAISRQGNVLAASCPTFGLGLSAEPIRLYAREGSDSSWTEARKLHSPDPAADLFGQTMAMSANAATLVASTGMSPTSGRVPPVRNPVYLFDLSPSLTVVTRHTLWPTDPEDNDGFGSALAASSDGNTVVVGAPSKGASAPGGAHGAAYVYVREAAPGGGWRWLQRAKLQAQEPGPDRFGSSVAISGNGERILLGAELEGDSLTTQYGAAYLFVRGADGVWQEHTKIRLPTPRARDLFGTSVALSELGDVALVGASERRVPPMTLCPGVCDDVQAGAAFAYLLRNGLGDKCSRGDECASSICSEGVCCDRSCGDGTPNSCRACTKARGADRDGYCKNLVGRICRPSAGICDQAEFCDGGVNCPSDRKKGADTVCRPRAGECDKAEACDGVSNDCPSDGFVEKDKLCRPPSGECDKPAVCDGKTAVCPPNELKDKGVLCGKKKGRDWICDGDDTCDGAGMCEIREAPDKTVCELPSGMGGVCEMGLCVP